ncbi:Na+/H+ antiporter subunit C [Rhodovulum sp. 12E13]|nr:Na+/H+ antiporter subunit C [Rhodovulum sp. 12E13]
MEALLASAIGVLTSAGIYLILRVRTFPVVVGTTMLSYAVNLFLFASGRLALDLPPILSPDQAGYTDPLPQALVLTAIVISFGMTAITVMIALGAYLESGSDRFDIAAAPRPGDHGAPQDMRLSADYDPRREPGPQGEGGGDPHDTAPEGRR